MVQNTVGDGVSLMVQNSVATEFPFGSELRHPRSFPLVQNIDQCTPPRTLLVLDLEIFSHTYLSAGLRSRKCDVTPLAFLGQSSRSWRWGMEEEEMY